METIVQPRTRTPQQLRDLYHRFLGVINPDSHHFNKNHPINTDRVIIRVRPLDDDCKLADTTHQVHVTYRTGEGEEESFIGYTSRIDKHTHAVFMRQIAMVFLQDYKELLECSAVRITINPIQAVVHYPGNQE